MAPTRGMDFARGLLLKYGWKEGQGLGRKESGISKALKPKLKFDKAGFGHDPAEQFTYHWWEHAFNQAANNITVCETKNGVTVKVDDESLDISTRKSSVAGIKKKKSLQYGTFLKTSTLTQDGEMVQLEEPVEEETAGPSVTSNLTDEQLFKICGGRTAHKGARHGLSLNGKLARIEEQERQLLGLASSPGEAKRETVAGGTQRKKRKKGNPAVEEDGQQQLMETASRWEQSKGQGGDECNRTQSLPRGAAALCDSVTEDAMPQLAGRRKQQTADGELNTDVGQQDGLFKKRKQKTTAALIVAEASAMYVMDDDVLLDLGKRFGKKKENKVRQGNMAEVNEVETSALAVNGNTVEDEFVYESSKKKKRKEQKELASLNQVETSPLSVDPDVVSEEFVKESRKKKKRKEQEELASLNQVETFPLDVDPDVSEEFVKESRKKKKRKEQEELAGLNQVEPSPLDVDPDVVSEEFVKESRKKKKRKEQEELAGLNQVEPSPDVVSKEFVKESRKKKKRKEQEKLAGLNQVETFPLDVAPDAVSEEFVKESRKKKKRKEQEELASLNQFETSPLDVDPDVVSKEFVKESRKKKKRKE